MIKFEGSTGSIVEEDYLTGNMSNLHSVIVTSSENNCGMPHDFLFNVTQDGHPGPKKSNAQIHCDWNEKEELRTLTVYTEKGDLIRKFERCENHTYNEIMDAIVEYQQRA